MTTKGHQQSPVRSRNLVSLSSAPTAIRAAVSTYCQLLLSQSNNVVKLIVLDRLNELKSSHSEIMMGRATQSAASETAMSPPMLAQGSLASVGNLRPLIVAGDFSHWLLCNTGDDVGKIWLQSCRLSFGKMLDDKQFRGP
ncbi:hypothetical protein RHMOL_Rhmol02G0114300 [Rhododendron molle]|uniref:Uncharacterized protein n=1 Tax=Rhododendron molle TaxID=49168 RepID=A0ACC0PRA7_RHOML|nr:hypothetical protein RHMOL_Rhmol02G0114300 [Rhododendron molle]